MAEHDREISARRKARLAGAFYLLAVLTATFAEALVHGHLLFAFGFIPVFCFMVVTFLLYDVFKPVDRMASFLAAFLNLAGLAFEAVEVHLPGDVNGALIFHGLYCLLIGYLAFRSAFLPKVFGVLMVLGGLAWLASLPIAHVLQPYNQVIGFIGEGSLMLWLLAAGVNESRWQGTEAGPSVEA